MHSHTLVKLVLLYQEYCATGGSETDVAQFGVWLNRHAAPAAAPSGATTPEPNRTLVWLIHRLSKFFRYHAKPTLTATGLGSMDEYFFLVSIAKLGTPTKTEVYRDTITELTTGTQLLRRLIGNGLVQEVPDPTDGRVKRVHLTAKGHRTREEFLAQTRTDVQLKAGNLTTAERDQLLGHLTYLEQFHEGLYRSEADTSSEAFVRQVLLRGQ